MTESYHIEQPPPSVLSAICPKCDTKKPLDQFRLRKNGYREVRCKRCNNDAINASKKARYRKSESRQWRSPRKAPVSTKEGYKFCNTCEQEKPIEEFHLLKGKPKPVCIDCERMNNRGRSRLQYELARPSIPEATKEGYKVCNTCFEEKPLKAFKRDTHKPLEHAGRCKQCDKERWNALSEEEKEHERQRDRESRLPRIEQRREYDRKRRKTDEDRAKRREQIALKKATDANYREAVHQSQAEWRKNNPLTWREYNRRSKIKQKAARSGERISYKHILERDSWFCYICEKPISPMAIPKSPASLVFDHRIPLHPRKGEPKGTHTAENIHPAHKLCNERKQNKQFENLTALDRRGVD